MESLKMLPKVNFIKSVEADQWMIVLMALFLFTDSAVKYVMTLVIVDYLKGFGILKMLFNSFESLFYQLINKPKKYGDGKELTRDARAFRILKVGRLRNDVYEFTFATQNPEKCINLPVGRHIHFNAKIEGKHIKRSYTPTEYRVPGSFTVVMKAYEGGKMSEYIKQKKAGDSVMISGPVGTLTYNGNGKFKNGKNSIHIKTLCIACGGTGITPAFQILKYVYENKKDDLQILFMYASSTEDHILLKEELEDMNEDPRITIAHTVSRPFNENWEGYRGRVCKEIFDDFYGQGIDLESSLSGCGAAYCGPPKFEEVTKQLFKDMGFEQQVSLFRW